MEYFEHDLQLIPPTIRDLPHSNPVLHRNSTCIPHSVFFYQCIASIVLLLCLFFMKYFSPAFSHSVRNWLITDEIGTIETGIQAVVESLYRGDDLGEAFVVFCRDIIDVQTAN